MDNGAYQPPADGLRTFVTVWATQSLSMMGSVMGYFALTVWLTQQTHTPEELGARVAVLGLLGAIPPTFFAPIAGTWADRHDRKRTMLVCDILSALLSLVTAVLLSTGQLTFPLLAVVAFLYPALSTFHTAAFDTSYAMLLREEQLPRANGMMQTIFSLSNILSPGIAALLLTLPTGAAGALYLDAATFLFSALALMLLHIPSPQRTDLRQASGAVKGFWADALEGARFIWLRRPILWILLTFTISNFTIVGMHILMPLMVKFQLAPNAATLGMDFTTSLAAIQSALGIGGVVGGVLFTAWGGLKSRRAYGVVVPILIGGLLQIAFGFNTLIYVAIVLIFFHTAMVPITNSHSQAIWQTQTPREMQGRVFAVRRLIAMSANPLANLLVGVLTSRSIEAGVVIVAMGVLTTLWCTVNLFNPQLVRIDEKGYLDAFAARQMQSAQSEL